jgi:hypothetical protein
MNVDSRTVTHPNPKRNDGATRPDCQVTSQMTVGIVRHCQNSRTSAKLERRTYVLRSIVVGTSRVHHR